MREDLQQEKTTLDSYLKHHNTNMGKAEYLLTHKTMSGHFVRSKSEALIDMALFHPDLK